MGVLADRAKLLKVNSYLSFCYGAALPDLVLNLLVFTFNFVFYDFLPHQSSSELHYKLNVPTYASVELLESERVACGASDIVCET